MKTTQSDLAAAIAWLLENSRHADVGCVWGLTPKCTCGLKQHLDAMRAIAANRSGEET